MGDTEKKHCGAFVVMKSGKRYLFEPGESSAEYISVEWNLFVRVTEKGKVAFQALATEVDCIGGETWFFKDAWWGKQ